MSNRPDRAGSPCLCPKDSTTRPGWARRLGHPITKTVASIASASFSTIRAGRRRTSAATRMTWSNGPSAPTAADQSSSRTWAAGGPCPAASLPLPRRSAFVPAMPTASSCFARQRSGVSASALKGRTVGSNSPAKDFKRPPPALRDSQARSPGSPSADQRRARSSESVKVPRLPQSRAQLSR